MIDCLCLHRLSIEIGGKYIRYFDISNLFQHLKFTEKKKAQIFIFSVYYHVILQRVCNVFTHAKTVNFYNNPVRYLIFEPKSR